MAGGRQKKGEEGAKGADQATMTAFFRPKVARSSCVPPEAAASACAEQETLPAARSPTRSSPRAIRASRESRTGEGAQRGERGKESSPSLPKASPATAPAEHTASPAVKKEAGVVVDVKREEQEGDETHDKGLSEYEKMRQANIRRNNALLESLDIPSSAIPVAEGQVSQKKTCKKRKPLLALEEFMEPRRSGRRLALAEKDKSELLVALPDSWDEKDESNTAASSKRLASVQIVEDTDWASLEPPPSMLDVLQQLAEAQAVALRKWGVKATDWKQVAIDKWGPLVERAKVDDWQEYVSR